MSNKVFSVSESPTITASQTDHPLTIVVIEAVAAASNVDPTELPPIHDELDPDALNSLFHSSVEGQLTFVYAGFIVTAQADGTVFVIDET